MTNGITINNGALYSEELLSDEQLDKVQGGIATELVVAGITLLIERSISEAGDIKNLVTSAEYKAMSNTEKNKRLGKELANSPALNVILGGLATPFAVIGAQIKWRKSGTSDGLRGAIESIF